MLLGLLPLGILTVYRVIKGPFIKFKAKRFYEENWVFYPTLMFVIGFAAYQFLFGPI